MNRAMMRWRHVCHLSWIGRFFARSLAGPHLETYGYLEILRKPSPKEIVACLHLFPLLPVQ